MKNILLTSNRRGNALILVVGILVLLVLVATAFMTRVQSGRVTAIAQRSSAEIEDRARTTGRAVADEVAIALFPREIVNAYGGPTNANTRRAIPSKKTLRYGHDTNISFPFNFAPYDVTPWTNPPDTVDVAGLPTAFNAGPSNPMGGPSFGDTRWLRDSEPQRGDGYDFVQQSIPNWSGLEYPIDGTPETFTHWRHLTNLSRSGNAWRIAPDISDITGVGLVTDLSIPIEQWPITRPVGNPIGGSYQSNLWQNWTTLGGWTSAQTDSIGIPQNFFNLKDLDLNGVHSEIGERPIDAFDPNSPRWYVEKSLADTDGDGFTDALWHLNPQTIAPDTMQVVAVSVTDNSARLNANVATRFIRNDDSLNEENNTETIGHTPADLALVGQNGVGFQNVMPWRVGFMDNLANLPGNDFFTTPWVSYFNIGGEFDVRVDWNTDQWKDRGNASLLDELGIEVDGNNTNTVFQLDINPEQTVESQYGRLRYWQLAGRDPFEALYGLRPFTFSDELELRVTEGNNYQFVGSRFERSVNDIIGQSGDPGIIINQFLRSDFDHAHEASEFRDQLDNTQLLYDNRRKLTMFSGARNDLLPPWLRWEDRFWNRYDPEGLGLPWGYDAFDISAYYDAGFSTAEALPLFGSAFPTKVTFEVWEDFDSLHAIVRNWLAQSRTKVDLREYYADSTFGSPWWEANDDGYLTFAERAPLQLLLAMTSAQENGMGALDDSGRQALGPTGEYGFPEPIALYEDNTYQQTRLMAAGFASNLLAYRDDDDQWRQHSLLPFQTSTLPGDSSGTLARSTLPLSAAITPPILGRQGNAALGDNGFYSPYKDTPINGENGKSIQMLGLEAQPFLLEAFLAHTHQAKIPSDPWACCFGDRCLEVSQETCEGLLGGVFHEGEICLGPDELPETGDEPCIGNGACCYASGGCVMIFVADNENPIECLNLDGDWRGIDSTCEDDTCIGACCAEGEDPTSGLPEKYCIETSSFSCFEIGAAFKEYGTTCVDTACAPLGSCCFASSSCMNVLHEEQCDDLGGTYYVGIFCASKPCERGACCLYSEYSTCVETSEDTCLDLLDGTYQGVDVQCGPVTCFTTGVCCFGSSSCVDVVSFSSCAEDGGVWIEGKSCVDGSLSATYAATLYQDTWLDEAQPNQVHVVDTTLLAGEQAGSMRGHVLLDFSVHPAVNPSKITTSILDLSYVSHQGTPSTMYIGRLKDMWEDTGATWNSRNGSVGWSGGIGGGLGALDSTLQAMITVGEDDESGVQVDITPFVQDAIIYRNRRVSLMLYLPDTEVSGSTSYTKFASSEDADSSQWPSLKIQMLTGDNPCDGSCCLDSGLCQQVTEETCLTEFNGTYVPFSNCETTPCKGACCLNEGGCENISEDTCSDFGGTYLGSDVSCSEKSCIPQGACCLGSGSCLDVISAAACVALDGTYVSGFFCAEKVCLEYGACCFAIDAGDCDVISRGSCETFGGTYRGLGSTCQGDPCQILSSGACCIPLENPDFGGCVQVLDESACAGINGTFYLDDDCAGGAFVCPDFDPASSRACCLDTSFCVDKVPQSICEDELDGFFLDGPCSGSTCTEDDYGEEVAACCLSTGTCVEVPQAICEDELNGLYNVGDSCDDEGFSCEPTGACCVTTGQCEEFISLETCNDVFGNYLGIGTTCESELCIPRGSCCLTSGSCIDVLNEEACESMMGGTWSIYNEYFTSCVDGPCTGSCCLPDGACVDTATWEDNESNLGEECRNMSGVFIQGITCLERPCVGACCLKEGDCEVVSQNTCVFDLNGAFESFQTDCESLEIACTLSPEGSCCLDGNDGCSIVRQNVCTALGGSFIEGGVCTAPTDCPGIPSNAQWAGACCLGDICVDVESQNNCVDFGGSWLGEDTSCASNGCVGACCLPSGSCIERTASDCASKGGTFLGNNTTCDTIPCRSACCLPSGSCLDIKMRPTCEYYGGTFIGYGSSCASRPCDGACCLDCLGCERISLPSCNEMLGTFIGMSTICDVEPCKTGACCLDSGTCVDTTLDNCETCLGGWYSGDGEFCVSDPCLGACCLWAGGCELLSIDTCRGLWDPDENEKWHRGEIPPKYEDPPGYWNGFGTFCPDTNPTDPSSEVDCIHDGACCLPSGTCVDIMDVVNYETAPLGFRYFCEDLLNGVYREGENCIDEPCIGACCFTANCDSDCENLTKFACEVRDGDFMGYTLCEDTSCPTVGGCCFDSGSCSDRTESDCIELGGNYQGDDNSCAGPDCVMNTLDDIECVKYFLVTDKIIDCPQETVSVVQLANPFDREIDLNQYAINVFGQEIRLEDLEGKPGYDRYMKPSTPENPATVVLYSLPSVSTILDPRPVEERSFKDDWLDFLDLEFVDEEGNNILSPDTMLVDVNAATPADFSGELIDTDREYYDELYLAACCYLDPDAGEEDVYGCASLSYTDCRQRDGTWVYGSECGDVECPVLSVPPIIIDGLPSFGLFKFDGELDVNEQKVLIDRMDRPDEEATFAERIVWPKEPSDGSYNGSIGYEWSKLKQPDPVDPLLTVGSGYITLTDFDGNKIEADPEKSGFLVMWERATRAWATDIPEDAGWHDGRVDSSEKNPRYVFAARDFVHSQEVRLRVNKDPIVHEDGTVPPLYDEINNTSAFLWIGNEGLDPDPDPDIDPDDPDDLNGDGNVDNDSITFPDDADLLADNPDPWLKVHVWSPRAGKLRPHLDGEDQPEEGDVQGGITYRKPTHFDMNREDYLRNGGDSNAFSYPDKGWYGQTKDDDIDGSTSDSPAFLDDPNDDDEFIGKGETDMPLAFPMQMLQKDKDFEQVGELMNVWLFGHMLEGTYDSTIGDDYLEINSETENGGTITTFSEFMYPSVDDWWASWVAPIVDSKVAPDARVNRLRFASGGDDLLPNMMAGRSEYDAFTGQSNSVNHAWPRLSIAARVLDSFVCDGPGRPDYLGGNGYPGSDGIGDDLNPNGSLIQQPGSHAFFNANGYTGKATPGLININTASVEVLRTLPHMYKVVHETNSDDDWIDDNDRNPRSLVPESIIQWRETANGDPNWSTGSGYPAGPNYSDRSLRLGLQWGAGPKNTRGFSSPAEIGMLQSNGTVDDVIEPWNIDNKHQAIQDAAAWRIDFAGLEPFMDPADTGNWIDADLDGDMNDRVGAPISTDVNTRFVHDVVVGDGVSQDSEELNLLQSGISNLITTTSDIFTVHMRIRTFKRNPITDKWDATDQDYIVDDSRYVMLVDRSNVNSPSDKPKILYFEKIPN